VLTGVVALPGRDYPTSQKRAQFREEFAQRMLALPGVEAVATTTSLPTAVRQRAGIMLEGAAPSAEQPFVLAAVVSDDYFRTLHIPSDRGGPSTRETMSTRRRPWSSVRARHAATGLPEMR
jgi:hypothetical protein